MKLIQGTNHLTSLKGFFIQLLGKYSSTIMTPDKPSFDLKNDSWSLYRRTNPTAIEVDFVDSFWDEDKAHREKHAQIALALNNGTLNIPVRSIFFNDLLCLQIGLDYVELSRHKHGWEVCTAIELTTWDHWLVVSGAIN